MDEPISIEEQYPAKYWHLLGDGRIHCLLQIHHASVAILMGIPILEGNILRRNLDEAGAGLGETPGQETAEPELPRVVLVVAGLGFERQIESLCRRRIEQAMRIVERA